jgi:putative hemolysin
MNRPVLDALGVGLILTLGGLLSVAQAALGSLREGQVRALAARGARGARVARLVGDPERVVLTVRIGTTLAGLSAAAFAAVTLAEDLMPTLLRWGVGADAVRPLAVAGVTLLVAYAALVVAELVPHRLVPHRAERWSLALAGPLDALAVVVGPLRWLLAASSGRLPGPTAGETRPAREHIGPEELRELVAAHEALGDDERRLIDEVFSARDCQLREVMVPRTEVDFIDASLPVSAAVAFALVRPHSRYPVVRGSHDDVVGFINIRDLLDSRLTDQGVLVGEIAREVPLLPATNRVLPALSQLRQLRAHLAIVVDEYGGTAGIVTLEDLVEELVGEIHDEYDEMPGTRRLAGGALEVDGLLNLEDFAEETGVALPEGPYETVAGFVVAALGHIPRTGESATAGGHRFTVAALDGRRIARVRITALPPEPPAPDATPATDPTSVRTN